MEVRKSALRLDRRDVRRRGYTLAEALIALAVAAIILTVSVPPFTNLLKTHRLSAQVDSFFSVIYYSRSESVKCNCRLVLCPSADGEQCLPVSSWHAGWMLFKDPNQNRERDASEEIVYRAGTISNGITVTSPTTRRRIVFQPNGLTPGSNATFTFCDSRGAARARAIVLSNVGRPRKSSTKPDGSPLECD
jgi:type IV fimbrial biogenesis protein FimT